jgi:hypothetical protein
MGRGFLLASIPEKRENERESEKFTLRRRGRLQLLMREREREREAGSRENMVGNEKMRGKY